MKYEPAAESIARTAFSDHISNVVSSSAPAHIIEWKNGKGSARLNSITYILVGNHLTVVSDIGNAIFALDFAPKSFQEVANLSYEQLSMNCVASPTGNGYACWDISAAEEALKEKIELRGAKEQIEDRGYDSDTINFACNSERYLTDFMAVNADLFNDDDLDDIMGVSYDVDSACTIFLVGLNMALSGKSSR